MSSFKRFSIAAVLLGLGVLAAGVNVSALSTGGIGGRPANPNPNNPRTQSIFIFNVTKGDTKRDTILVANNSDAKQTIELYAVDGIVTNTGSFTCSQESEAKQGVGSWIAVDKGVLTLDPGKTEEVDFSLMVPATADVGEHNGCIVFQVADDKGEATGNVRIRTRQAIRVVATVPGELYRSVDIQGFSVSHVKDEQVYKLNLKNNGNVSADVDAKVYLTSLFAGMAYENGGGYPVLANQKLSLTFVNESRPMLGGWYYVQAKVSYDKRAGTFGTSENKYLTTKTSERKMIYIPPTATGVLVMGGMVIIASGLAMWYAVRRRTRLNAYSRGYKYVVRAGDSITSVADKHAVDWKKIASVNKIAAPYVLQDGQVLRIPAKKDKKPMRLKK